MSATTTTWNNTTFKVEAMSLDMPVPIAMVIGLVGFLIALGAILHSKKKVTIASEDSPSTPKAASTPTRKKNSESTPTDQTTGSIQTPAGRRSARLAKRRKED